MRLTHPNNDRPALASSRPAPVSSRKFHRGWRRLPPKPGTEVLAGQTAAMWRTRRTPSWASRASFRVAPYENSKSGARG